MVTRTDMPDTTILPSFVWDVSARVGISSPSSRGDVMLVQFLLNKLIRRMDLRDTRKRFNPAPDNPLLNVHHGYPPLDFLTEDGYCGKETSFAIKQYQLASPLVPFKDGDVDPLAPVISQTGGDHRAITSRTIYWMNADIFRLDHGMPLIGELPALVRADLAAHGETN